MDWLDLLAVQGTLKSLLQHHSSKASILWHSAFFRPLLLLLLLSRFSRVRLCDPMDCSTPGFPVHHQLQSLLKLMSIESVMPSNHLIFYCPLLFLPSIFPSIRVFSNESVLRTDWPKYWNFSLNMNPSNEYSGLISFRMD